MERILLIDGWNIMIAQNAVTTISDSNANPIGMYITTISQIRNLVVKLKPNKVFFCLDGPNAGDRRKKLYPSYKSKRGMKARSSKVVILDGDESTSEFTKYDDVEGFDRQLCQIYDFLKLLPVTVCIIPYCEADDVITYISLKNKEDFNCIIVSTDKDYLQLIDKNIHVYNWKTKKLYNENEFISEFKMIPQNYIFRKIILGDASDEVKSIKSIGPKTFDKIFLNELKSNLNLKSIGDFFSYIDNIDISGLENKFHKHISLLKEEKSKEKLLLSYRLMKLDDDYMSLNDIELLIREVDEQKNRQLSKLTAKLKMLKDSFGKMYGASNMKTFNADIFLQPFMFVRSNKEINL